MNRLNERLTHSVWSHFFCSSRSLFLSLSLRYLSSHSPSNDSFLYSLKNNESLFKSSLSPFKAHINYSLIMVQLAALMSDSLSSSQYRLTFITLLLFLGTTIMKTGCKGFSKRCATCVIYGQLYSCSKMCSSQNLTLFFLLLKFLMRILLENFVL